MSYSITQHDIPEKAMAPHSSTLAWKIPWMADPGRLQSMGLRRVGHDRSDLAAAVGKGVECEWVWLENQDGLPGGGGPGS